MTNTTMARGWTADWLNGWLAAIGATVLMNDLRLSWSRSPRPAAVLHDSEDDLASALFDALPTKDDLESSATARELPGAPELPRNFDADVLAARAARAREHDDWTLGPCVSDLVQSGHRDGRLDHGAFDVPMPRGITLFERVLSCRQWIDEPADVQNSMDGIPDLAETNGLGFDPRRLEEGALAKSKILVDPVVELLAWSALVLFPVTTDHGRARSRGWRRSSMRPGAFRWGTWAEPLDRWGIDARLDLGWEDGPTWESVPYQPSGSSDVTRAYASRRVRDA